MKKEFVPYEVALELKELEFVEPCYSLYNSFGEFIMSTDSVDYNQLPFTSAPTYSQAFRWFREKYKVRFFIQSGMSDLGEFFKVIFPDGEQRGMSYTTYEEAELACLKKLIEVVKTK